MSKNNDKEKKKLNCIVTTTRFNNKTYKELKRYKELKNISGCIYNVSKPIAINIDKNDILYVVEMNNDTNKIIGIGMIQNKLNYDTHEIYSDKNYNRYTYIGKYRLDREELISNSDNKKLIEILEEKIFKGKSHLKRGQGITRIPEKYLYKKEKLEEKLEEKKNEYLCLIKEKLIEKAREKNPEKFRKE